MARVCQFYGVAPGAFMEFEDSYEHLAVAEALMYRLLAFEKQQADAAEAEAERKGLVDQSLAAPGTLPRVEPPSPEEVLRMIQQRG
jgi:hypothetical protein